MSYHTYQSNWLKSVERGWTLRTPFPLQLPKVENDFHLVPNSSGSKLWSLLLICSISHNHNFPILIKLLHWLSTPSFLSTDALILSSELIKDFEAWPIISHSIPTPSHSQKCAVDNSRTGSEIWVWVPAPPLPTLLPWENDLNPLCYQKEMVPGVVALGVGLKWAAIRVSLGYLAILCLRGLLS